MEQPLVTVVIPTFNAAGVIRRSLSAVIDQSYRHIEIFVVDNASSDDTTHIVAEYAAVDSRIQLVNHDTNLGRVANWNSCLRLGRGEYLKFALANDVLYRDCITQLVDAARRFPTAAWIGSNYDIDSGAVPTFCDVAGTSDLQWHQPADALSRLLRCNVTGGLNGMLISRASLVESAAEFDVSLPWAADWLLACRLAAVHGYARLPTATYLFDATQTHRFCRQTPNSVRDAEETRVKRIIYDLLATFELAGTTLDAVRNNVRFQSYSLRRAHRHADAQMLLSVASSIRSIRWLCRQELAKTAAHAAISYCIGRTGRRSSGTS